MTSRTFRTDSGRWSLSSRRPRLAAFADRLSPFGSVARVGSVAWGCVLLMALPARSDESSSTDERPNIIVILADDQGWADIGYHGSDIRTPNLDRLAAEGARLNRHYVYPTCSPTRVALLSGRFPSRFDVLTPLAATTKMRPHDARLPHALRDAGYSTHLSGKWHIGETPEHRPRRYGFDTTYGYLRGQIDPYTHRYKFGDHVTWHRNDEFVDEPGHVTDLITDEAVRVIEESGDEPFFLYVAHHSPHSPLNEPPSWIDAYEDSIDDIWRRHFAAAVTHLDHGVGRIVEALERTGKRDRTLIVYSSDNGGQRSWPGREREYNGRYAEHKTLGNNEPLRGWKGDLYEGGIRVPALVNWPGRIDPGGVVDHPTHVCDLAPTLIGIAGGEIEPGWRLEGVDLEPTLLDPDVPPPPRTVYWRTRGGTAILQGDWKLIRTARGNSSELYNLSEDPYETDDRAGELTGRRDAMLNELAEIRAEDWSED